MIEQSNGQGHPPVEPPPAKNGAQSRYTGQPPERTRPKTAGVYTGEILLRTRPKTYYKIVQLLAEGRPFISIARDCKVSIHSVHSVRMRRAKDIEQRKKEIVGLLGDVATLGSERMVQTIGKASLRDASIGVGISCDKILSLTGQTAAIQIANLVMPSEEEREERRQTHARLDAIVARLSQPRLPQGE
jgi:hypothetical protein